MCKLLFECDGPAGQLEMRQKRKQFLALLNSWGYDLARNDLRIDEYGLKMLYVMLEEEALVRAGL